MLKKMVIKWLTIIGELVFGSLRDIGVAFLGAMAAVLFAQIARPPSDPVGLFVALFVIVVCARAFVFLLRPLSEMLKAESKRKSRRR